MEKEPIIISLGGSIVVPEKPDEEFIKSFKALILELINTGKRFFIIVGGGKTCRIYNSALSNIIEPKEDDLDWLGIYATRLNALFVKLAFGDIASKNLMIDPNESVSFMEDVVVGAGWLPGFSTDADAIFVAEKIGAKKVINLSNIDFIYDSDPKINHNAKKFENLTWKEYKEIIGDERKPGANLPFDPVASKRAEELGIEVAFIGGNNLESLKKYISGEKFVGTIIK